MSTIYEPITLSWKGKEITVQPTFRLVQNIESRGVSIYAVYQSIARGEPRVTQVAEIISALLVSGGAKATVEEVYSHLVRSDDKSWESIALAIFAVFMPRDTRSGNSEGLEEEA